MARATYAVTSAILTVVVGVIVHFCSPSPTIAMAVEVLVVRVLVVAVVVAVEVAVDVERAPRRQRRDRFVAEAHALEDVVGAGESEPILQIPLRFLPVVIAETEDLAPVQP